MRRRDRDPVTPPLISVVIPALDEAPNIAPLRAELCAVIDELPYRFEVIVVDNDSGDGTGALVKAICAEDPRWKYVRLSRDFGAAVSISAGYRHASGDAVIVLYADLQEPPGLIPEFLERWEHGFDVVYGVQTERIAEPRWSTTLVHGVYRVIARMAEVRIPPDASDFRLVSREVVDALGELPERSRYLRGLVAWLGFRQTGVPYQRRPRTAGQSKSSMRFLVRFVFDAITGFSLRPLRYCAFLAGGLSGAWVLWGIWVAIRAVAGHDPSSASLLGLLIVALASLQATGLWMLSEYIGRIHVESRQRPLYLVAEAVNVTPVTASEPSRRSGRSALRPMDVRR